MAATTIEPMEYSQWCETLSIAENSTEGKETLLKECHNMLEKDLHMLRTNFRLGSPVLFSV